MQDHSKHTSSGGSFHGINADARILKITGWLTGIYFIIELGLGFLLLNLAVRTGAPRYGRRRYKYRI